jgi:hypothetical protein
VRSETQILLNTDDDTEIGLSTYSERVREIRTTSDNGDLAIQAKQPAKVFDVRHIIMRQQWAPGGWSAASFKGSHKA